MVGAGGCCRIYPEYNTSALNGIYFTNKLCRRPPQYAPAPCKLTFDLLTLKVVHESRVTWATSVPILVFLDLSVLDVGPMYATDRCQTDVRCASSLNACTLWGRSIIIVVNMCKYPVHFSFFYHEDELFDFVPILTPCAFFPSVLWHCWLGDRKGIRPVKKNLAPAIHKRSSLWNPWRSQPNLSISSTFSIILQDLSHKVY